MQVAQRETVRSGRNLGGDGKVIVRCRNLRGGPDGMRGIVFEDEEFVLYRRVVGAAGEADLLLEEDQAGSGLPGGVAGFRLGEGFVEGSGAGAGSRLFGDGLFLGGLAEGGEECWRADPRGRTPAMPG